METKEFYIDDRKYLLIKLDSWKRLMFVADLQKDILVPLLDNIGEESLGGIFSNNSKNEQDGSGSRNVDIMNLLKSLSNVIDSRTLEKWVKRILSEGMIAYVREDGQKVKLSFQEITKIFSSPQDIISLVKEAISFNLEGMIDIINDMGKKKSEISAVK